MNFINVYKLIACSIGVNGNKFKQREPIIMHRTCGERHVNEI